MTGSVCKNKGVLNKLTLVAQTTAMVCAIFLTLLNNIVDIFINKEKGPIYGPFAVFLFSY